MPQSRFHDGRSGASHAVRSMVFGRELRIVAETDATLATWKLADVRSAPERDPDGMVALTARDQPGVLLVGEGGELELLRQAGIALPGRHGWSRAHWAAACAALVATVALGVLALNTLPRWLAATIPVSWERQLGAPAEAMLTTNAGRCDGSEGQAALDRFVARLRAAGDIEMPVTLTVLDRGLVNAFTLPGGHVLVMRGLIDAATDGAMLAGVIAHELGHVTHRDSTTLMLRSMGLSFVLNMLGFGNAGGVAASGASTMMNLAYTRAAEAAADATAIDLLNKAGVRADGLSRFFAVMEKHGAPPEEHDRASGTMNWFETHPPSEVRREVTARPETGEMPFTEAEWAAIKGMCGKI